MMRRWKCLATTLVVVALGLITAGSALAVVNVVSNFPSVQGQNGLYLDSYNAVTGAWSPLSLYSTKNFRGTVDGYPRAWYATSVDVLHPLYTSAANLYAVVTYKAPAAGTLYFNLVFTNQASGNGCSTRAILFKGNVCDTASTITQGIVTKSTSGLTLAGNIALAKDECFRIAVDSNGAMSADSTGLSGTVNLSDAVIPEPGALVGLGSGLFGAICFGLRRRR